jgi:hypothetical protein
MAKLDLLSDIEDSAEVQGNASQPNLGFGEVDFDPTGGEGGIPTLTVGGGTGESTLEGVLPGTAALKESIQSQDKTVDPSAPRDRFGKLLPSLEQGFDEQSGLPTLTATPQKEKSEGVVGKIQEAAAIGTMGVLESFGVPTRALGATVTDVNPFASASDKGKPWDEVFKDPEGGIFKEARRIVRDSDMNGAIKFILEMGLSIPEDPLVLVGALTSGLKSGAKGVAKRSAAKKETTKIDPTVLTQRQVEGQADVLLPSGEVNQRFTPAEREFVSTGKITPETARKEISAITKAPEVKAQLDAGRTDNIISTMQNIRKKHGLTDTNEGGSLFAKVEGSVDDAVNAFRKETNELYDGVNKKADPSVLGDETRATINDTFTGLGISDARKFTEAEVDVIVKKAQAKGDLTFTDRGGKLIPVETSTGKVLTPEALTKEARDNALDASDLGLSNTSFAKIKKIQRTLNKPNRTLINLRNNRRTLDDIISESSRKGQKTEVDKLTEIRRGLTRGIRTQINDVIGDADLTREWMLADDFMSQNASGVKAAGKLMFNQSGKQRTGTEIAQEFAKVPTRKKGAVIDSMMDFFDEKGLQNLRNMFFNDIIEKSSTNGKFTGQKLRNVINAQPENVFNKVFTAEMKQDMSDLLGDAISDDLAKEITRARLGKFSKADKESMMKTIFGNPAYRIWATTSGFTKAGLKRLSIIGTVGLINSAFEKKAIRSASSFLKGTSEQSLTGLTFKALKESAEESLKPRARVVPNVVQRDLNRGNQDASTDKTTGELNLLEGL